MLLGGEAAGVDEHARVLVEAERGAPARVRAAGMEGRGVDAERLQGDPRDAPVEQVIAHAAARREHQVEAGVQVAQVAPRQPCEAAAEPGAAGEPGHRLEVGMTGRDRGDGERAGRIERAPGDAVGIAGLDQVRPQIAQHAGDRAAAQRQPVAAASGQRQRREGGAAGRRVCRPAPRSCAASPPAAPASRAWSGDSGGRRRRSRSRTSSRRRRGSARSWLAIVPNRRRVLGPAAAAASPPSGEAVFPGGHEGCLVDLVGALCFQTRAPAFNRRVSSPMDITEALADGEADKDAAHTSGLDFFVVGIGASAGGLAAIKSLLEGLPATPDMAFVVVLHLSPTHESNAVGDLPELDAHARDPGPGPDGDRAQPRLRHSAGQRPRDVRRHAAARAEQAAARQARRHRPFLPHPGRGASHARGRHRPLGHRLRRLGRHRRAEGEGRHRPRPDARGRRVRRHAGERDRHRARSTSCCRSPRWPNQLVELWQNASRIEVPDRVKADQAANDARAPDERRGRAEADHGAAAAAHRPRLPPLQAGDGAAPDRAADAGQPHARRSPPTAATCRRSRARPRRCSATC